MDKLDEIRQRVEQLVRIANNPYCLGPAALLDGVKEIVPALLSEVDRLKQGWIDANENHTDDFMRLSAKIVALTARAEAAEADRDAAVEDLRQNGFCGSCSGCNAPHDPNNITWCYSWQWRGPQDAGKGEAPNE